MLKQNPFELEKIKLNLKRQIVLPELFPAEKKWRCQLLNYMYAYRVMKNTFWNWIYEHRFKESCDAAVVELFFATGARVYEISNIRSESINLNSGLIRIMGKGGKERYIQISNEAVLVILRKYYAENEKDHKKEWIFFRQLEEKESGSRNSTLSKLLCSSDLGPLFECLWYEMIRLVNDS